ncbi:MAG: hypothetical protein HY656_06930 [Acidobacteria bacterium]|nr:hypothetical protein [Acidobacteriota bacterium]
MLDPASFLLITLDSCRFDTFHDAHVPNLKAVGPLHRAMAPGYFTYASHQAMFVGFTPGDSLAREPFLNPRQGKFFRMVGGGRQHPRDYIVLEGANIIQGLARLGYLTLGTGAVGWFNPATPTGRALIGDFDRYFYPGNTYSLPQQIAWVEQRLREAHSRRVFLFINVGETHVPYYHQGAAWPPEQNPCLNLNPNNTNDTARCRLQQRACLEFADRQLAPILERFRQANILICADHGDCWGEDDLWAHGFHHPKVLEVPLVFRLGESPAPPGADRRPLWRRWASHLKRALTS